MTPAEINEKFVGDVKTMTNEELEREMDQLIQWEGEHGTAEPRIDELTMELLFRELLLPEAVLGIEIDEESVHFVDAIPNEEVDDEPA